VQALLSLKRVLLVAPALCALGLVGCAAGPFGFGPAAGGGRRDANQGASSRQGAVHANASLKSRVPPAPDAAAPAAVGGAIAPASAASPGCGDPPPVAAGTSADGAIESGGLMRTYRLHVPAGYRSDQGQALVLSFHGDGGDSAGFEAYTGLSPLADQQGFIAVYPQGVAGPGGYTGWSAGDPDGPAADDVDFTSDLLDYLEATLCVDPRRVYASGFSSGGGMTGVLACKLSGRIAAFAAVSGAFYPLPGGCSPGGAVAVLELHGDADAVVPYWGGADTPPIPGWLSGWAARDGCADGPSTFSITDGVTGEAWAGCAGGGAVVHYRIGYGDHAWPGPDAADGVDQALDADAIIWQFFEAHPLA
jgi:polyhydroxybutyrate depolymerase